MRQKAAAILPLRRLKHTLIRGADHSPLVGNVHLLKLKFESMAPVSSGKLTHRTGLEDHYGIMDFPSLGAQYFSCVQEELDSTVSRDSPVSG